MISGLTRAARETRGEPDTQAKAEQTGERPKLEYVADRTAFHFRQARRAHGEIGENDKPRLTDHEANDSAE